MFWIDYAPGLLDFAADLALLMMADFAFMFGDFVVATRFSVAWSTMGFVACYALFRYKILLLPAND